MAGKGKGGFGMAHGGSSKITSKLVDSPMGKQMAPKAGGKMSGRKK